MEFKGDRFYLAKFVNEGTSWGTASIELLKWKSRCIWGIARRPVCLKQGGGWEIINWTRKKWVVWGGVLLQTESPSLGLGLWFLLWLKQKDIVWFEWMGDMIWQVTGSCVLSWEHPKDQEWKHWDQLVDYCRSPCERPWWRPQFQAMELAVKVENYLYYC